MCNDLGFLAHLPELCDITFMVGTEKEPVCAVRAVLGELVENIDSYFVLLNNFSGEKSEVFRKTLH